MDADTLTIGALADAAGVNVETVRYYERRGLIEEPPRSPAGYRQYSDDDLWRLRFIARAKGLGFTLAEIREMIGATGDGSADAVLAAARAKLAAVDSQQRQLVERRRRLEQLVAVCQDGDPSDCTALDIVN